VAVFSIGSVSAVEYNIIPYPQKLTPQTGQFSFNKSTVLVCLDENEEIKKLAQQFAQQLELVSGLKLSITNAIGDSTNAVIFQLNNLQSSNPESYTLDVSSKNIRMSASAANGIFYALQSMYQLMPAEIYGKKLAVVKKWSVPAVQIADFPRFGYRGLHLDVCRHFFSVAFIKKYIDAMAIHKLNNFHWHLTDDQGWRIEIKKYPLLTKVGSRRVETLVGYYYENLPQRFDDDAYGGFYTQDEAREIVAYARERFITVIPEIEMPGHAMAAIASYPFLSCTRLPIKVATKWGIFKDVYCPRDSTFDFLENVLTEIMDIFPGNYIHIGGDECPKDRWKVCPDCQALIKAQNLKDENGLQSYFVHRIEKFLNAHGRMIIGWDEILDGGLAPNATVMSWRGMSGGVVAAKSGHNVIMTPGEFCYLDRYQSDPVTEPITIGGFTTIEKVYSFEPVPTELDAAQSKFILGAQANIWTEYMATSDRVEYMAFPRVSALSEVLWTDSIHKDWGRFKSNMPKEFERYGALNIKPAKVYYDVQCKSTVSKDRKLMIALESDNPMAKIYYTIDGQTPSANSKFYNESFKLSESATVKAMSVANGKIVGKEISKAFVVSKITGLDYVLTPTNSWYKGDNAYSLTDGIPDNTKTISQWVAISGSKDGEIAFDLQKTTQINHLSVGLLSAPAFSGMYPSEIKVLTSFDGITYDEVAIETLKPRIAGSWEIYRPELVFPLANVRYVKLVLKSAGDCKNIDGAVGRSTMFLDEISVW
jgi:hexosaminidase